MTKYIVDKIAEIEADLLWKSFHKDILQELVESDAASPFIFVHCKGDTVFECVVCDLSELSDIWHPLGVLLGDSAKIPCIFVIYEDNKDFRLSIHEIDKMTVFDKNKTALPIKNQRATEKEKDREADLYLYLLASGIDCHKQASTKTKTSRFDIWIPGKCIIELKSRKIASSGVCQAIRYYVETKIPVVLVGDSCGQDLVDTINSFNEITRDKAISFVPWSLAKDAIVSMCR